LRRSVFVAIVTCVVACETQQSAPAGRAARTWPENHAADSLLDLGQAVYKRAEYDSARALLTAGRAQAVKSGDSSSVARADTWLGLTAWKKGEHVEARKTGEAALAMKQRLGLAKDLFVSYNALGLLAWTEGRFGDAIDLFDHAHKAAAAQHDTVSLAKAIGNLGNVHSDLGDLDNARNEIQQQVNLAHALHDTTSEANAMANLGMVYVRLGDPGAAIGWLEKARVLHTAVDYPAGQEADLGQLGSAYASLAEPQRAIAYMDSAMRIARAKGLVREEAEDLHVYGDLLGEAGDHQAALRHLARARMLADSAGLESRPGDIARSQAQEEAAVGRLDIAISRANEAASLHRKSGSQLEEMRDQLMIAELAQVSGNSARAREALSQAQRISTALHLPVATENVQLGTARVEDKAGDPAAVLRALPADVAFQRMGVQAEGEAQALRARAFARLRQWPEAAAAGQKAVASLEMVRENIGEGPLRSAFVSDNAEVYADLVIALLQLGRTSDAFEVADAARGKALIEHLNAVKTSARGATGNLAEADRLLRRIDYLTEQLRSADTIRSPDRSMALASDARSIAGKISAMRAEYEDMMKRAARGDPRGASLLGVARTDARAVRAALRPGEALLDYLVTPRKLFVFVVTRDTIVSVERPVKLDDLVNRVLLAEQILSSRKTAGPDREVMRALNELLMQPVENEAAMRGITAVVIVPHSVLAYMPFAALIGSDGRRLIEKWTLVTLPSASSLPTLRAESAAGYAGQSMIFAPFPGELVGTRAEAASVSRATASHNVFMGSSATETQLRSALAHDGIVHVASHGVMNAVNPMFSRIELASGKSGSPEDDGSLELHVLLQMPVKSGLVYLSGCETGLGASWSTAFMQSQDYATLSQALLYAGARNVIATLWRIDDLGASVFAQRFYSALSKADPGDALAIAQRSMIRDARYAAPRYWAAYTISGSGLSRPGT
jgi:CHAT domain-containing protein/tetratricopeptide (TPR) repeat protein